MKKYNNGDLTAETLMLMMQEVNSWDGSLGEYEYYANDDEFFNLFYEGRPRDAVRAAFYGEYHYMDDYVRITDLGNLESTEIWGLEAELIENTEEIAEKYMELVSAGNIDNSAEVVIWSAEEIFEAAIDEYGEDLAHVSRAEILDYCQDLSDRADAGYDLQDLALQVANDLFEGE